MTALTEHPGPYLLVISHRNSWGILPQTPVFSLRSAWCHWQSLIIAFEADPIIGWTGQAPANMGRMSDENYSRVN